MKVPFFDYRAHYQSDKKNYLSILDNVLSRGAFIMQKDLLDFEKNLKNYLDCEYAIGVADGTAALTFSLKAAGIKQGDEVIVSTHTFIATAAAINHIGATPVISDCLPDSMIDCDSIKKLISKKTKAIMPTQLNGRTCEMNVIENICKENNLKLIEDSCQALGAKYNKKFAGLFGVAGSFSFFPAKTLGGFGDGGAVVTNNKEVAEYIYKLRDHGRDENGKVSFFGYNGRLDNIQAAILNYKLKNYDKFIQRRRNIANIYNERLKNIDLITLPPGPSDDNKRFDVFQNYEIQADNRDQLRQFLTENEIGTLLQWSGLMLHQFKELNLKSNVSFAEKFVKKYIMLPMNNYLTDDQVNYVCDKIIQFYSMKS